MNAKSTLKSVTLEYQPDEYIEYIDEKLLENARRFAEVRLIKKKNPRDLKEEGFFETVCIFTAETEF